MVDQHNSSSPKVWYLFFMAFTAFAIFLGVLIVTPLQRVQALIACHTFGDETSEAAASKIKNIDSIRTVASVLFDAIKKKNNNNNMKKETSLCLP